MSAAPPTAPLLEARGLVKHFGGGRALFRRQPLVRAVDGVTLDVARGETFALVGESGCGKSTLARLLLRLIEPTAGSVRFAGEEVTAAAPERLRALRREMQIVFQDPYGSLNPRLSVGELVAEPIRTHGLAKGEGVEREVARLLDLVGLLPEHARRYPHEFSGGQRQRVGIARALASKPRLVVGDEPVSALDVSVRAQIINLLQDLKAELGLTLVLVSHDLGVVRHVADRVAVMYLGEVVELAPVDGLFADPRHPYTRALLDAIPAETPSLRRARAPLEGDPPSPTAPPPGCRFHTRCPFAIDRCRVERPALAPFGQGDDASGHAVACHRAAELPPFGAGSGAAESERARARIALFARAAAAAPASA